MFQTTHTTMTDFITGEKEIKVEIFKSFEEISSMQQEWDRFMESVDAEIFLTYDWCRIWWKFYGRKRELSIFIFRRRDDICAILPLFFEKIWIGPIFVRVVKMVGTDYMPVTITVPIKKDFIDQIAAVLFRKIEGMWRWDLFYLGAICGRYDSTFKLLNAFKKALNSSYFYEVRSKDVQTYFTVANSWEHQVAKLSRKQRTNVKRTFREMNRKGIFVSSVIASKKTFLQMFNNFIHMHQSHWQKLGKPGHFGAWPASSEFHCEVASVQIEHNRLRLIEIKFNDQIVGYEYIYQLNSTYFWFLNARIEPKYSPEIDYKWISFHEKTKNALKDGVNCIDGMRGRYNYKLLMGGNLYPVNNIFIYPKNYSVSFRIMIFRLLAWFLDLCYSRIWRTRITPRLVFRPKVLWDKWIRFHILSY